MDGYAPAYVAHNVPYLVVSGLDGAERNHADIKLEGVRIASDIPPINSEDADVLIRSFKDSDANGIPWNGRAGGGRKKFKVKMVGRDYVLPRRTARPPDTSSRPPDPHSSNQLNRPILHSTLSPLTPSSPLFPDGIFDPKWVEKHQDLVPSAYISFYKFTSDPKLATLHDNQLKTDINNIKRALSQSGYKTRLIVALLSESSILKSLGVEDRLINIRKATGLDSKTTLFFLPPQSSPVEIQAFVDAIISTIYPLCIEYYRDLSKHSRRKRNRGIIPPPTSPPTSGTLQTLSSQGWNVRYDFKLGVFAEFRQEMDAAVRSYESGYELLLGPDVLEAIASWNLRWNEARLLSDVFAIRIIRCLLWNGNSTAAVRRWCSHRERIRDFVDRRGKGSSTYAWEAWEARWATVMAEIVKRVSIPDLTLGHAQFYLHPEKTLPIGERLEPIEYLHHPGYWFYLAAKHLVRRRTRALAIPDEDRSVPGSSPSSQIANKAHNYDTYLCPPPHEEYPLPGGKGVDHPLLIIQSLEKAIAEFDKRKQSRLVHELSIQLANESMKREDWSTAFHILRPLWQKMTFRSEGWWDAVEEVAWALRKVAVQVGDGGAVISVDWELLHRSFVPRPDWHYDLTKSLEDIAHALAKPVVVLHDQEVHSFLTATFAFEKAEGKVGELCHYQLVVRSQALQESAPITMSEIRVEFEGSMKPLELQHKDTTSDSNGDRNQIVLSRVSLSDAIAEKRASQSEARLSPSGRSSFVGEANLTIWPGQTKVFWFSSWLREAGDAKAVSVTFSLNSELFDLDYVHRFEGTADPDIWWNGDFSKRRLLRPKPSSITVLPKAPKVELRFVELQDQYYANENIMLQLEVVNGEDADSSISLDVRLLGDGAPPILLKLPTTETEEASSPLEFAVGKIASAASSIVEIHILPIDMPSVYDLTMKASYHLVSDMETPIYHSASVQLSIINPFEANYDFAPRVHPDRWPSYFNHEEMANVGAIPRNIMAHGLAQKWCLTSRYFSFAADELIIEDLNIEVLSTNGAITCTTKRISNIPTGGIRVSPKSLEEAEFDVFTQKISLDDRTTATLDVSLAIKWRREKDDSILNTTILAVPRLLVSSSEPRVLSSVSYSATIPSMVHLDVILENPSNHFLTFGLNMEPSEKFAFSGVKQTTLQLVPLSRRTMRFRLVPFVRGDWIGPIRCLIRDKYFQKVLKIAPTEGMKIDKEGILIWVPPEDE